MLKPDQLIEKDKGMLNNKYNISGKCIDEGIKVKNPEEKYNISGKCIKILK